MAIIEPKPSQIRRGLFINSLLGSSLLLGSGMWAQAPDAARLAPLSWSLSGSKPANYRNGIDTITTYNGQPSAFLRNSLPGTDGYGTLMQTMDARKYAGKRLRLRAAIRSQNVGDWAGLWMRIDRQKTAVALDNMQRRAIKGTQSWSTYDVVLDVPTDATSIALGVLLSGAGQLWINQVTIETVGPDAKITGTNSISPSKTPVIPELK